MVTVGGGGNDALLRDTREARPQGRRVDLWQRRAVDLHHALLRIVETLHELEEGGLARPGRPHDRDRFAGYDLKREIDKCGEIRPGRVEERHLIKADPALRGLRQVYRMGEIGRAHA